MVIDMADKMTILNHIHVNQGDITLQTTDAIVNAANPSLLGGGGVDGAIHRAAGPDLLEQCRKLGGCKHGEAKITAGHNLPAKHVIHTPGPVYRGGGEDERDILTSSYRNSLTLAKEHGLSSISFPAISTGIYGYPKREACEVAIITVVAFMEETDYLIDVYFVLFDAESFSLYNTFLEEMKKTA